MQLCPQGIAMIPVKRWSHCSSDALSHLYSTALFFSLLCCRIAQQGGTFCEEAGAATYFSDFSQMGKLKSNWVVEAIALAYISRGLQPMGFLWAYSTRRMAASWALFRGVSVHDTCSAINWSSPLTSVQFFMADVAGSSVVRLCMTSAVVGY